MKAKMREAFVSFATAVTLGLLEFFAVLTMKPEDMSRRAKNMLSLVMVGIWFCFLVAISWIDIRNSGVSDYLAGSFVMFSGFTGICIAWIWR
jgi:membrane-associated HD superfamily phosphohydrolase